MLPACLSTAPHKHTLYSAGSGSTGVARGLQTLVAAVLAAVLLLDEELASPSSSKCPSSWSSSP